MTTCAHADFITGLLRTVAFQSHDLNRLPMPLCNGSRPLCIQPAAGYTTVQP